MPYRLQPGSWQPARLRWIDHAILMVCLIVIAFARGVDYLVGDDTWGARDFMMNAAPEWVWGGIGYVVGAAILSAGVCTRRHLVVYVGHGWLAATYGVTALALAIASGPAYSLLILLASLLGLILVGTLAHALAARRRGVVALALILVTVAVSAAAIAAADSFDGIRSAGSVGLISLIHFAHMLRTGGRPLRVDRAEASEQVVDGGTP